MSRRPVTRRGRRRSRVAASARFAREHECLVEHRARQLLERATRSLQWARRTRIESKRPARRAGVADAPLMLLIAWSRSGSLRAAQYVKCRTDAVAAKHDELGRADAHGSPAQGHLTSAVLPFSRQGVDPRDEHVVALRTVLPVVASHGPATRTTGANRSSDVAHRRPSDAMPALESRDSSRSTSDTSHAVRDRAELGVDELGVLVAGEPEVHEPLPVERPSEILQQLDPPLVDLDQLVERGEDRRDRRCAGSADATASRSSESRRLTPASSCRAGRRRR